MVSLTKTHDYEVQIRHAHRHLPCSWQPNVIASAIFLPFYSVPNPVATSATTIAIMSLSLPTKSLLIVVAHRPAMFRRYLFFVDFL